MHYYLFWSHILFMSLANCSPYQLLILIAYTQTGNVIYTMVEMGVKLSSSVLLQRATFMS